eukprot:TRINITY_DN75746_c0_g1_i1.p1 TRINITY_DN75746_c0_g1~~TRINITY_DN75746_c0_g1_i1.p1  ORF type:complete len:343 (+),score=70.88 TRINITY_DN75746_c0_g1_i1:23-1030(+)
MVSTVVLGVSVAAAFTLGLLMSSAGPGTMRAERDPGMSALGRVTTELQDVKQQLVEVKQELGQMRREAFAASASESEQTLSFRARYSSRPVKAQKDRSEKESPRPAEPVYRDSKGVQHLISRSPWSQYQQDLWVAKNHAEPGFYLDIGAHHSTFMSNTYLLDRVGWQGVCVEALVYKERHWEKRTCEIVEAALVPKSSADGTITFTNCEKGGGRSGQRSGHSGLSGEVGKTKYRMNCPQVTVKALTFLDILDKLPATGLIDYMSLDVEGAELHLLQSFPWEKICIERMNIESNTEESHTAVKSYVLNEIPRKCEFVTRKASTEDFYECNCNEFKQ